MVMSVPALSGGGTRPRQRYKIVDDLKVIQARRARARQEISKLSGQIVSDTRDIDRLLVELYEEMDWASLQGQMSE